MPERTHTERRFPRIPSRNSVLVTQLDGFAEGFAKTEVVGLGGLCFVSDESLGVDSILELFIAVNSSVAKAVCRVAYERRADGGKVEIGVEFLKIGEPDLALLGTLLDGHCSGA